MPLIVLVQRIHVYEKQHLSNIKQFKSVPILHAMHTYYGSSTFQ